MKSRATKKQVTNSRGLGMLLEATLKSRQAKKPSYSLRSFASSLNLSAGLLSRVIHGKRSLSYLRSEQVIERLNLSKKGKMEALNELRKDFGLSKLKPAQDVRRFADLKDVPYKVLNKDSFQLIASWYHSAIYSLYEQVCVEQFEEISRRIGIEEQLVQQALERMTRLKLYVKKDGKFLRTAKAFSVPRISSQALRHCHKELIYKSFSCLEKYPFQLRDVSGLMLTIDPVKLQDLIGDIAEFRDFVFSKYEFSDPSARLYYLGAQLFPLERPWIDAKM